MFSPALQSQLVQTHIADLHHEAGTARLRPRAPRQRRRRRSDPITGASSIGHADSSMLRFAGHYAEMVAVMFAGMFTLMPPTGWLFSAFGTSWSGLSPAMNVFAMALTMTVPMVAWMRYRGHAWRPNLEMAASMLIPTFAVMGLLSAGIGNSDSLTVPEHAGMLACMLAAMLLRRDEYSCGHGPGHAQPVVTA